MSRTIADVIKQPAQATQASNLSRAERGPLGPESDDRDIVNGTLEVDHSRPDVPISALETDIDIEHVMDPRKMAVEAFYAQKVTVLLQEPAADDESPVCEVTVNGHYIQVPRGIDFDLPRSHLEVIARAKQMSLRQVRVTNPDGSIGYQEKAVLRHTYPFSIIFDPAGRRGVDWIKQLMRNPS